MKKRWGKLKIILAAALLLPLCACSWESGDTLYSLPELPPQYYDLQKQIDQVQEAGAKSIAPAAGYNRQAIQLVDLDGDGKQEAVSFFSVGEDLPLRIYVYKLSGSVYHVYTIISEDGESFDSIYYEDVDGDGINEIIAGVKVGQGALKVISVYSIAEEQAVQLMSSDYTDYTIFDINNDGIPNILLIRYDDAAMSGQVDKYVFDQNSRLLILSQSAPMSAGIGAVQRLRGGTLVDGYPALFVDSSYGETGYVTDIFANRADGFVNITLDQTSGVSTATVRQHAIFASDINNDEITDFPHPVQLMPHDETAAEEDFWIMKWRSFALSGLEEPVLTTYHNFSDEWYYILPDNWVDVLSLRRISATRERSIEFSLDIGGIGQSVDVLTIYVFTGDSRQMLAQSDGRFVIYSSADTVVAGKLSGGVPSEYAVTQQQVINSVFPIEKDWITGQ